MFPVIHVKTEHYTRKISGQSRIRVITPQGTISRPVDFSATDPHEAAIKTVYGDGAHVEQVWEGESGTRFKWEVFA